MWAACCDDTWRVGERVTMGKRRTTVNAGFPRHPAPALLAQNGAGQ
jgi:hypothetical protein